MRIGKIKSTFLILLHIQFVYSFPLYVIILVFTVVILYDFLEKFLHY